MFSLSQASQKMMIGVHPDLVRFMEELIGLSPHDFKIICEQQRSKTNYINMVELFQEHGEQIATDIKFNQIIKRRLMDLVMLLILVY